MEDCVQILSLSLSRKKKKDCPRDQLIATECPLAGRKRRVFYDDCNCPYLKCCGMNTFHDYHILINQSIVQSINESTFQSNFLFVFFF